MFSWRFLVPVAALLTLAVAAPAPAQTPLTVTEAELAVPFGAAKGQLAIVADRLVFVAAERPESSLTIERADVASLDRAGEVVTVVTKSNTLRFRVPASADLMAWYESAPAIASPPAALAVLASYSAKHDHRIGSCRGTLVLTADRVAFESLDEINDSRQWQLADIKEVDLDGIYKLKVVPFFGDTFNFEFAGKGMSSGEFRELADRIARARTTR